MQKCQWPGCSREQNAPYCFPHGRGSTVKPNSKPVQPLSIPELIEKCQKVVNAFIRDRDRVKGCITCGGQVVDAGHFIPISENTGLRFDEDNIAGQCARCNRVEYGKRPEFRIALITRIGIERVQELENTPKYFKWSRTQLENIYSTYSLQKAV